MDQQIFICYSREDHAEVIPLVDKLRERGLNIWIDQEGIYGAKLWSQEIVHAIERCKVFILFASRNAFGSKNVTKELALASESDKNILPIFIEGVEIPTAMKYQLAGIQHLVHQKGQPNQTVDNILRTLGNLDEQTHQPTATPVAATPPPTTKAYKSTIDLCVVTFYESGSTNQVTQENRVLRDELVSKLSHFRDFKIILGEPLSPDATSADYQEVAAEFDADFILQASSSTRGHRQKISAQVLNGTSGRVFWTTTFKEGDIDTDKDFLDESTAIISAHVACCDGAIALEIYQKALVKKREDLTPIELLQLGIGFRQDPTKENLPKQIGYLKKCIELDPEISTAHSMLSIRYLRCFREKYNIIPDGLTKAKESSRRAIQLDPKNGLALFQKAYISWYERNLTAVELEAKLALEANPYESIVLAFLGAFYTFTGRNMELGKSCLEDALRYTQTPDGICYQGLFEYYLTEGSYPKALEYVLKMDTADRHIQAMKSAIYWLNDQKESALRQYNQLIQLHSYYTLKDLNNYQTTLSAKEKNKALLQKAFQEVVEEYNKSKA